MAWAAGAVAEEGDFGQARLLAEKAEIIAGLVADPSQRAWALRSVTRAVALTGNLDRAETIARSIIEPAQQAAALISVAEAAAESGDSDKARLLADEIEDIAGSVDPDHLDDSLKALSRVLANIGELKRAEATARSISHPYIQIEALVTLTELAAKSGDLAKAEAIARSIAQPYGQDEALTSFAHIIAEAGDIDRARKILAATLITTDPFTAFPAVAAIDPSAVVITAQHFSGR